MGFFDNLFGDSSASAADPTAIPTESSDSGLPSWITQAGNLFTSVVNTYDNFQNASVNRDVAQYTMQTNAQIEKIQADAALKKAQTQANYSGFLDTANMNQAMANINSRLAGVGGTNNVMLWLTVAGVAVAVMQYMRSR